MTVRRLVECRRQLSAPLTALGAADGAPRHDVAELEGPGSRHGGAQFKHEQRHGKGQRHGTAARTTWETRSPRRGSIGGLSGTTTTCLFRVSPLPPSHRPMDMTRRLRHPLLALGPPSSTAELLDRCRASSPMTPMLTPTTTRWTSRPGYRRRAVSTIGSNRWSHRQQKRAAGSVL